MKALKLFYSYSHKDETHRETLETHLKLLEREGIIESWHDRKITAGSEWGGAIDEHLDRADIILLVISADFIASDYSFDIEMTRALERHEQGEARVIPVIVRPTAWKSAPFAKLQVLPKDGKAVVTWPIPDEAWQNVAEGIRRVAEEAARGKRPEARRWKVVLRAKARPEEVHCVFGPTADFGRSRQCDFSFTRAPSNVSNLHARLSYNAGNHQFFIEDLGSSNGTYVNSRKILAATPLGPGTRVSLASALSFLFHRDEGDGVVAGALIYDGSAGRELSRYVLVPEKAVEIGDGREIRLFSQADGIYALRAGEDPASAFRLDSGTEVNVGSLLFLAEVFELS